MTVQRPNGPTRLAYLVSQYPEISHAFIETEIAALRDLGVEVHTFSARPPDPADLVTDRARQEAETTAVLQSGVTSTLPRALTALLRRSPSALGSALRLAARSGPRTLRGRIWQIAYLLEALVLWWHLDRIGVRHVHVHFSNNGADIARLAVALGNSVDGPNAGWAWSLALHGPTEFEDVTRLDLPAKLASAAKVACITDFARSQAMRHLVPAQWDKLGLVRMAVESSRFAPPEAGPGRAPGDPLRVLTVGRLVPEKGLPLVVEAVARLRDRGVATELTVVGGGPLADDLAAEVRDRGLSDVVKLLGPIGQTELPALYRTVDAFCLPSFAEGLPVVLMEAMATGLPVVTTAIAGIPELVVDRQTGLLLPPGRVDRIADALEVLAKDRELGRGLGAHGRDAVMAEHAPRLNAQRLLTLLFDGPTPPHPTG